jgi:hypothetical protein
MWTTFQYATNFNQDLSARNMTNVTTILGMFHSATNFNQDLSARNMTNVTNMFAALHYTSISTGNYDSFLISLS